MFFTAQRRKPFFPFTTNRKSPAKPVRPTLFFAVFFLLSFQALAAPAAQTARKQIYAYAAQLATADINRMAQEKQWKEHQYKMNVFIPSEASNYRACSTPLQGSLLSGEKLDLARMRYEVRCEGNWDVAVTIKPDVYVPVVVAKVMLERNQKVAASHIELKKHNISHLRNGYITDPDEVVGLTVKRRIRNLQPISPSQLDQPILVERGQQVIMLAGQGGVEARTMGEALKAGRKGDLIKVRNISSNKIVTATVDDLGVVRTLYAPGNK